MSDNSLLVVTTLSNSYHLSTGNDVTLCGIPYDEIVGTLTLLHTGGTSARTVCLNCKGTRMARKHIVALEDKCLNLHIIKDICQRATKLSKSPQEPTIITISNTWFNVQALNQIVAVVFFQYRDNDQECQLTIEIPDSARAYDIWVDHQKLFDINSDYYTPYNRIVLRVLLTDPEAIDRAVQFIADILANFKWRDE